jgi:PBSX family phage portal protein
MSNLTAPAESLPGNLPAPTGAADMFTFGEPEAVLDRRELFDLFEVYHNSRWFEPPIPPVSLGKTLRMAPHHQSAIMLKRNLLAGSFAPTRWLNRSDFSRWVLDWIIFGNAYLERIDNISSRPMALKPIPAAYTRVGIDPGVFWYVTSRSDLFNQAAAFRKGTVHHLIEPDPLQEIYGAPEYLSALQSGLLNEAATIFRRRYYKNGSHAGFILYVSEEGFGEKDSNAVRQALRDSKGPGNFRNLYVHIPKGKKDGLQILPIGEVTAKDDFLNIKDITAQDLLVAHRTPPILVAMMPKNTGGFGNVLDATDTFFELEIVPIQQRLLEVNDWLGLEAVAFTPRPKRTAPAA